MFDSSITVPEGLSKWEVQSQGGYGRHRGSLKGVGAIVLAETCAMCQFDSIEVLLFTNYRTKTTVRSTYTEMVAEAAKH